LSLAWLDCDPSGQKDRGNFAAIGSFEPGIEIWDMDMLDAVEPVATLGGADYEAARTADSPDSRKKTKKKKSASKIPKVPVRPGSHEDAVLGLAWNREYRNVLASASGESMYMY
jgi:periodic tryptophan protein 1